MKCRATARVIKYVASPHVCMRDKGHYGAHKCSCLFTWAHKKKK